MSGHAPYIMPDGRTLAAVLKAEGPAYSSKQQKKTKARPKDEMWGQLQLNKRTALSDAELAEIRAIERVGHRRRRQWLNDKLLRDLAGPMSQHDMESQFKPIPFGFPAPPSAFTLASAPEHAAVWDHFRSIDSDKEARVLQAWEAHNRRQQPQLHHAGALDMTGGASGHAVVLCHQQAAAAAAAAALAKWSRVDKRSRAALKKASVHSVLALELQALQLIEQGDPNAQLLLDLPDAFARLLVHGLAQYHSLQSSTCLLSSGQKSVRLQCKHSNNCTGAASSSAHASSPKQEPPFPQQEQQQQQQQEEALSAAAARGAVVSTVSGPDMDGAGGPDPSSTSTAAEWLLHAPEITCTDIIMALQELGDTLNHHSLGEYIKSVHGSTPGSVRCASF